MTMQPLDAPPKPVAGAKASRVHWEIRWTVPEVLPPEAKVWDVSMAEAERRLGDLVRTAVHHAVVSGRSEITIRVNRSSGKIWVRK